MNREVDKKKMKIIQNMLNSRLVYMMVKNEQKARYVPMMSYLIEPKHVPIEPCAYLGTPAIQAYKLSLRSDDFESLKKQKLYLESVQRHRDSIV